MHTVIIVIHLMVVVALVVVVLLQRSEGGALGIGGGGGGGFMTGRGTANVLTRATAILALVFFTTSMTLTILAGYSGGGSILDQIRDRGSPAATGEPETQAPAGDAPAEDSGGVLDQLRQQQPAEPQVPQSE